MPCRRVEGGLLVTKNEEMIVDLAKNVAILGERLNFERRELERVDTLRSDSAKELFDISRRVAVIEDKLNEFKKTAEENDRRRWMLTLAFIGSLLTLAVNLALIFFRSVRS
jgi:predicted  nucleic acid-binding Zn-ribbon protein